MDVSRFSVASLFEVDGDSEVDGDGEADGDGEVDGDGEADGDGVAGRIGMESGRREIGIANENFVLRGASARASARASSPSLRHEFSNLQNS